jgi:hypothetical protein
MSRSDSGPSRAQRPTRRCLHVLLKRGRKALAATAVPYTVDINGCVGIPRYAPAIERFFQTLTEPPWVVYAYDPEQVAAQLQQVEFVAAADLEGLRPLLSYLGRGERYCDGFWLEHLQNGTVDAVLLRLEALAQQ